MADTIAWTLLAIVVITVIVMAWFVYLARRLPPIPDVEPHTTHLGGVFVAAAIELGLEKTEAELRLDEVWERYRHEEPTVENNRRILREML